VNASYAALLTQELAARLNSLPFGTSYKEARMKTLGSILVLGAALIAMPAFADSSSTSDKPIVLAGGQFCVGPACIGRDRDRDWG
jgi:hypothetical protein